MILLYGLDEDSPYRAVRTAMEARGAQCLTVDQASVMDLDIEVVSGAEIEGSLRWRSTMLSLDTIEGFYLRPYETRAIPRLAELDEHGEEWARIVRTEDALWSLAEVLDCRIVNRPSAMRSNDSKPFQLAQISPYFEVPDTLITNDRAALARFRSQHPDVIYKSTSAVRSVVNRLSGVHDARLEDLSTAPVQFQEFVPGTDFRAHVVGREVFAARILSESDDYRYGQAKVEPAQLPDDIAQRCVRLVDALGLSLGGVDLRLTPDGRWFCFEVNPSPAFTCYECGGRVPIRHAIAAWLDGQGERDGAASTPLR